MRWIFRPNQHLQNKGKTKHIELSENCIDWFIAHSTENLGVASTATEVVFPALQLLWNRTSVWVFSCKFAVYFQSTFS